MIGQLVGMAALHLDNWDSNSGIPEVIPKCRNRISSEYHQVGHKNKSKKVIKNAKLMKSKMITYQVAMKT